LESKLKNNIKVVEDGRVYEVHGVRVLSSGKKKLPEENYVF
jgi:hypothetical protein